MTTTTATETVELLTTLITLDINHPATRTILVDAHHSHKLTMSGFAHLLDKYDFFTGIRNGHADHRRALNILYATTGRPDGTLLIRLQSDAPPQFTNPECDWWRDAIPDDYPPVTRRWKTPLTGTINYQIRAQPLTTVNGRRRAITNPDKQLHWWRQQATKAGLHLTTEPIIDQPITLTSESKHNGDKNKNQFHLKTLRYTGTATITDPEKHHHALTTGIGRGQPYGAALLMTQTHR